MRNARNYVSSSAPCTQLSRSFLQGTHFRSEDSWVPVIKKKIKQYLDSDGANIFFNLANPLACSWTHQNTFLDFLGVRRPPKNTFLDFLWVHGPQVKNQWLQGNIDLK